MAFKFEDGKTYNTVKTLGVALKEGGYYAISQRTGKDAPDIMPTEQLTFSGREGGKLWFTREDGTRVVGHISHFDPSNPYNTKVASPANRVKKAEAKALKAAETVQELAQELNAALSEVALAEASMQDNAETILSTDSSDADLAANA